jgi:hypothetical protein
MPWGVDLHGLTLLLARVHEQVGLIEAGRYLLEHPGIIVASKLADIYITAQMEMLTNMSATFPSKNYVVPDMDHARADHLREAAMNHIIAELNVCSLPIWTACQGAGRRPFKRGVQGLMGNPLSLTDDDLYSQWAVAFDVSEKLALREVNATCNTTLVRQDLTDIKKILPANMGPILEAIISATCHDDDILEGLGIARGKRQALGYKMNNLLSVTIPKVRKAAMTKLKREGFINEERILTHHMRVIADRSGILRNRALAQSQKRRSLLVRYPELLDLIRSCTISMGGSGKLRGDTPVDQILMEGRGNGSVSLVDVYDEGGGITDRVADAVSQFMDRKHDITVSRSVVYGLFGEAGVAFMKPRMSGTEPKIAQHYAATDVKTLKQLSTLFANDFVLVAMDQCKLFKVNTGGHIKGTTLQIKCEHDTRTNQVVRANHIELGDHDNGADTLGKLRMYTMLQMPATEIDLSGCTSLFPDGFKAEEVVPGWCRDQHFLARPGLGVSLGHKHSTDPESSASNCGDFLEMMERFPDYFANSEGDLVSGIGFILDNAHGPAEQLMQFCVVLLADVLDLDVVVIACNAGGFSKYNPAERGNGAITRRSNQYPIFLDLPRASSSTFDERDEALDLCLERLVHICNGATLQTAGGFMSCFRAG